MECEKPWTASPLSADGWPGRRSSAATGPSVAVSAVLAWLPDSSNRPVTPADQDIPAYVGPGRPLPSEHRRRRAGDALRPGGRDVLTRPVTCWPSASSSVPGRGGAREWSSSRRPEAAWALPGLAGLLQPGVLPVPPASAVGVRSRRVLPRRRRGDACLRPRRPGPGSVGDGRAVGVGQLLSAAVLYWTLERTDGRPSLTPAGSRTTASPGDPREARLGILTSLVGRPEGCCSTT